MRNQFGLSSSWKVKGAFVREFGAGTAADARQRLLPGAIFWRHQKLHGFEARLKVLAALKRINPATLGVLKSFENTIRTASVVGQRR